MEFDRDKSFGYPVLRPIFRGESIQEMDFVRSQFEPAFILEVSTDRPDIAVLDYEFDVSVPEIIECLENGQLGLIVDIRCRKTFFSRRVEAELKGQIEINLSRLRDVVKIHPYIIAKEDFAFSSSRIHSDFGYTEFNLERGNIIAWHPPLSFSVEKEQYRSVRSIIDFQPDKNINFGEYWLSSERDYAIVHAHPDFIEKCRVAEQLPKTRLGLLAAFYVPVIAQLLLIMAKNVENVDDHRWSSILRAQAEKGKLDWRDEMNIHKNAQELLKKPLNAFSTRGFMGHD